ncbi:GNAT family N-acetyltransferase [Rouxiella badensis]|jgi:ribosomal-protein-alanine N-acetyltransferase|uniref:GNAT family N-acetyltransferase n=1 Tax=Rouxiella badensis TaxID=1646377 RepID=A0A1X0WBV7_9GAMM|nr:GNAT family N-acetyltransferase [Rouxiella badensis]MCC3720168.1 GNAT family N-acetyltransferase [Rouxiella badensis]MCC3729831.1 GNAT family N-acetyltransferase [Rouxiella badensis]MCC3733985.1 GNAT family N-acetyltransferase [Rouxiella badensis]MCC3741318.1 GNAT family N-acetyltransferase [Rouxiella badensis]MCC3748330.1 GNAT family N-acetyltransferase [Rouxiella badensis]
MQPAAVPVLNTERLILQPLSPEDAPVIQRVFPHWEIVQYLAAAVPWPFPDNGAHNYVNNVALAAVAAGTGWFWTLRHKDSPSELLGVICLTDAEDNNRGFWLRPEWQRQGIMAEASMAVTDFWFNTLNREVLRAPKASLNRASKRISESSGMRLLRVEKKAYVGGEMDSELWEITRDEWNALHQKK